MAENRLMKDGLGADAVERIVCAFASTVDGFPAEQFRSDALNGLDEFELKERVAHLITVLHQYLPEDFERAAASIAAIKTAWNHGDESDPLRGFAAWPIIDYIGVHGLNHPETSLNTLKHLTSLFSAEFAIRPFILNHPDMTFLHLKQWCGDPDEHVRRLVSEGSRPRLPWGQQLPVFIDDPLPLLPLLELLKDDESEYVRRSVANSLNDISKDHPDIVIQTCRNWLDASSKNRSKLIRHATRTLVKDGHPDVFGLLGYTESPRLSLQGLKLDRQHVELGELISFTAEIKSMASMPQSVVVDYAVHQVKANGKTTAKVFKLK
ncbi:MAG: hypothetical protein ABUK11_08255, partial [Mariprofundaceae bacterium]